MSDNRDVVVRALAAGGQLKAAAVRTTEVGRALIRAHDPGPLGAVALTRVAGAALLCGTLLKGRQQIGITINGDGPLGELYAIADAHGHVRATVHHPRAEVEPGDERVFPLSRAVGRGKMTVTRRLSDAPAYLSVVPLTHGGIGEDLAYYFAHSEQVPTAVGLGEWLEPDGLRAAGGYLIQALPGADEAVVRAVEERVDALPPLSQLFAEGIDAEGLLARLLDDVEVLERNPALFRCDCERPRFARILVSLGSEELARLRDEQEITELTCHFCNTTYTFDHEEMGALLLGARMTEQARR